MSRNLCNIVQSFRYITMNSRSFILGALIHLVNALLGFVIQVFKALILKKYTFLMLFLVCASALLFSKLCTGSIASVYEDPRIFGFVAFFSLFLVYRDEYSRYDDNIFFLRYEKSIILFIVIIFRCFYLFNLKSEDIFLTCAWLISVIVFVVNFFVIKKERPLPCDCEDLLYRSRIYNKAHISIRELAYNANSKGLTIGICGEWGSGKSFFLQKLRYLLSKPYAEQKELHMRKLCREKFVICDKVELWEASSIDDAWDRLFVSLYTAITGKEPFFQNKFVRTIIHLMACFLPNLKSVKEIYDIILPNFSPRSTEAIDKCIGDNKVVLFIDDLERADYTVIKAILPLFERLKKISNLIVICSIAEGELLKMLKCNGLYADLSFGFLNKLFDLRIELPLLSYVATKNYLVSCFRNKYSDCKLTEYFLNSYPIKFDNPRQIDRVLEKISYIERQFYAHYAKSFEDLIYDEDVLVKLKYVFIVEILKLISPGIIEEIDNSMGLKNFFGELPPEYFLSIQESSLVNREKYDDSVRKSIKEWESTHPVAQIELKRNGAASSILMILYRDVKGNSEDYLTAYAYGAAISQEYARVTMLHENELEMLIQKNITQQKSFDNQIREYLHEQNEIIESESIDAVVFDLINYIFKVVCKNIENEKSKNKNEEYLNYLNDSLNVEVDSRSKGVIKVNLRCFDDLMLKALNYSEQQNNNVNNDKFLIFKPTLILIYGLLSYVEQVSNLYRLRKCENLTDSQSVVNEKKCHIKKAFEFAEFKKFVKELTVICARRFCYAIDKDEINEGDTRSLYTVYTVFNEEYTKWFKEGVENFVKNDMACSFKFYLSWFRFIRKKYSDFDYTISCANCFISQADYDIFVHIKKSILNNEDIYSSFSVDKIAVALSECQSSLDVLRKELSFWTKSLNPDSKKFVDGISRTVSMLSDEESILNKVLSERKK